MCLRISFHREGKAPPKIFCFRGEESFVPGDLVQIFEKAPRLDDAQRLWKRRGEVNPLGRMAFHLFNSNSGVSKMSRKELFDESTVLGASGRRSRGGIPSDSGPISSADSGQPELGQLQLESDQCWGNLTEVGRLRLTLGRSSWGRLWPELGQLSPGLGRARHRPDVGWLPANLGRGRPDLIGLGSMRPERPPAFRCHTSCITGMSAASLTLWVALFVLLVLVAPHRKRLRYKTPRQEHQSSSNSEP